MSELDPKFASWGYRIGHFFFPVLEPFFILVENRRASVRRHLDQAIQAIETKDFGVALLNLNLVLELKPNHFLARVYRGRIHLFQRRFVAASEDFILAKSIHSFRFIHYNLHMEYLDSANGAKDFPNGFSEDQFNDVLKSWVQAPDVTSPGRLQEDCTEAAENSSVMESDPEEEWSLSFSDPDLNGDEVEKFEEMGPISGEELERTDWDQTLRKLIS